MIARKTTAKRNKNEEKHRKSEKMKINALPRVKMKEVQNMGGKCFGIWAKSCIFAN